MKKLRDIAKSVAEWLGVRFASAPEVGPERALRVVLDLGDEPVTVGRLTVRPGVFVFEYAEDFKKRGLPAIPSLPDVDRVCESEVLFPFFQVRLPPKSRTDVADAIAERQISTDDTFEMLRVLGERSVASPYRFADVV